MQFLRGWDVRLKEPDVRVCKLYMVMRFDTETVSFLWLWERPLPDTQQFEETSDKDQPKTNFCKLQDISKTGLTQYRPLR
jgi:hypothetical protein